MRKIKWGVLGTAYIFERDTALGMQLADNCELTAIAGRNPEKAAAFKEKYGFQKAYGSYEELLADPEIEAVYIPLPNTLHYEWTIKALQQGKHVLCEKPLAPSAKEAEEMFRAAKENHVYLMEAFAYQHSPFVKAVKKEIESGTIGEIRYMEAALITSDYLKSNIRMRKEIGSFNEDQIDVYTTGIFEYAGGARASFDCGMVLATEKNACLDRFQIHGTKGSISSVSFGFNCPGKLSYEIKTFDGRRDIRIVEAPHNYRLEVEQLGRCITEGETPYVTEDFSVSLARTIDRVLKEIDY